MPLAASLSALLLACSGSTPPVPGDEPEAAPDLGVVRATGTEPAGSSLELDHAPWSAILKARVKGKGFDYAGLRADPSGLEAYLATLRAVTPEELAGWSKEARFGFWINVYNAHTVALVVQHLPLKSIRDLDGKLGAESVFDLEWIPMKAFHPEGEDAELSLNDIENGILRPRFKDARVHAAINCASVSCPPLLDEAFVAERLDAQLDGLMRAFLADPGRNRFELERGFVSISKLFEWFEGDFVRDAGSVADYLLRFGPGLDPAALRKAEVRYLDYDWGLNAARRDT